jgi:dGTPase
MKAGMISRASLNANRRVRESLGEEQTRWVLERLALVEDQAGERARKAARKLLTSQLIHEFVTAAERDLRQTALPASTDRYRYTLRVDPLQRERALALKNIMFRLMVEDARVATLENKAERIIKGLFDVFSGLQPRTAFLFPEDFRDIWEAANDLGKLRIACDYIAGMTDDYAERVYARLYLPQAGSIYSL